MNTELIKELGYAKAIMQEYPKDKFFNLKRSEDLSTIYHGEFVGGAEEQVYWAEPPHGFRYNADILIAVIGNTAAIAIACVKKGASWEYMLIRKKHDYIPKALAEHGFEYEVPYGEEEILTAVSLIK